jgi:hypothetical protein
MNSMTAGFMKVNAQGAVVMDTNTYLTGVTSGQVTGALGYTPYNSSNPSGYVNSSNWAILSGATSYNTDRTTKVSNGLAIYSAYSGGANSPTTYDISAQYVVAGKGMEMAASWHSPSATMFFRTLRDCCDNWSSWVTMLSSANFNSYALPLTGGTLSGNLYVTNSSTVGAIFLSGAQSGARQYMIQNGITGISNSGLQIRDVTGNASLVYFDTSYNASFGAGIWATSGNFSAAISASNISSGVNASHIVQRDGNGYIYANHINFNTPESENPAISSFITSNGDGWSRKSSLAHVRNQLGNYGGWITSSGSITGNAATATYATNATRLYASDGSYVYGGAAPYYMTMTYDGSRWLLQVTPGTPAAVRVAYADAAGSASSAGNADTVDGYHATNAASGLAYYASNGYLYVPSWINVNGGGIFASTNNAHLRPNTGSYGAWEMIGSKNGWSGIWFNDSSDYLMANNNEVGHYQHGVGWKFRWYQGTMYISRGTTGGGSEFTVLDSGNYTNWAIARGGDTVSGQFSFTKTDDHAIQVGTIRGRAVGSQGGEFIQLYERVNIGGPNGWGASNTGAPTYGLSVFGGATIGYGNNGGLTVNGNINAPSGYVSNGNPWGTSNSAFFPNGITTAGGTNWVYGLTYLGNAPGNGSGAQVESNGRIYVRANSAAAYNGFAGQFVDRNSASSNHVPWSFENEWGNHSWGVVARFHIQQASADRPSIQFTNGTNNTRWGVGYCFADDNFRISQDIGMAPDGSSGSWGTERFRINTDGTTLLGIQGSNTNVYGLLRLASNNHLYLDNNFGQTIVGLYSASRYQGVFAMGDAYKLPVDGTSTGSLYGLAWSHPNAGGVAGNLNTHGLLVLENGGFLAAISGSIRARDDMRAPIFYDSNDTGYYLDMNSTSNSAGRIRGGILFGPNPTWGRYLQVGGNGNQNTDYASVVTTDGNLHLDSRAGNAMYLNYYANGIIYLNGATYYISANGAFYNGTASYANSAGNASTVGGYAVAVGGSANTIPTRNGSGYLIPENWIQLNGIYGLYSPTNNAHLRPNDASYGSWLMTGSRNGWQGIEFNSGGAGNVTMMISNDSNTSGFHNNSYGWQIRWANGTLFCGKNSYGGNDATVWDSSNAPRASNSHLMYYQGFTLNADTMDVNATGFTYAVNAPYVGPIVRFSTGGGYDLWLNAAYGGSGNLIAFRTRNGDSATLNPWREFITSGNIGNQSVSYANNAGNVSSISGALNGNHTWTNINYFLTNNGGYLGSTNTAKLQAFSYDNNSAFMSFHKSSHYAVNFGLDADNVMRIGGWSASANRWQLDMSGNMTVAGDVTAYSDARVKENVETIVQALDKVLQLRGVSYNRTDSDDKKTKIGVIAQETLVVVPEVVNQDNTGMYNVSYGNLAGLFIEAIKEQQKQIEDLKSKLDALTK